MDPKILSVVTGVSGPLGLLSLVVYLYFLLQSLRARRSVEDTLRRGGLAKPRAVVSVLKIFSDDASRVAALREIFKYDQRQAAAFLAKVRSNVDLGDFDRRAHTAASRSAGLTAVFFFAIAVVSFGIRTTKTEVPIWKDWSFLVQPEGPSRSGAGQGKLVNGGESAELQRLQGQFRELLKLNGRWLYQSDQTEVRGDLCAMTQRIIRTLLITGDDAKARTLSGSMKKEIVLTDWRGVSPNDGDACARQVDPSAGLVTETTSGPITIYRDAKDALMMKWELKGCSRDDSRGPHDDCDNFVPGKIFNTRIFVKNDTIEYGGGVVFSRNSP